MSPVPAELADTLRTFATAETVLLATDFDGTLAPFQDDPSTSRPYAGATTALRAAADLPGVTVALVSGRDLEVLQQLSELADDDRIVFIGTHGAQSSRIAGSGLLTGPQQVLLESVGIALAEVAAAHPGSRLEHKPAAAVLHTRGMAKPENARALAAAESVAANLEGVHLLRGKDVRELGVIDADKGSALQALADEIGATHVVYLGDDVTDECAFRVFTDRERHLMIKVGAGPSAAGHRVADVPEAVAVLQEFVTQRRTSPRS